MAHHIAEKLARAYCTTAVRLLRPLVANVFSLIFCPEETRTGAVYKADFAVGSLPLVV